MASSFSFKKEDLDRITGKINTLKANCSPSSEGPIAKLVLNYVSEYQHTVVNAMGSVFGDEGGSAELDILGSSMSTNWSPLSIATMEHKRDNGLSLYVWSATGKTEKAVKLSSLDISKATVGFFAGIDKATNPDEYRKAINTEFGAEGSEFNPDRDYQGKVWLARPLFTVANSIFKSNSAQIIKAIHSLALAGVNWGSR